MFLASVDSHSMGAYLGRRERLSQVCLNRWTVLLLLVLVRILFAIKSSRTELATARREALEGCYQVESMGNSIASMPRFMAAGVNDLTAQGLEYAVGALAVTLDMAVTGVEQIVLFVVHMMVRAYNSLIALAARGSMRAVEVVSSGMVENVKNRIENITISLSDASVAVNRSLSELQGRLNKAPTTEELKIPIVDFTDQISRFESIEPSSNLDRSVNKLGDSLPTFDETQGYIENLIRVPFEEVRRELQAIGALRFERSLFPVPQRHHLDFCSEGSSVGDFFDSVLHITVQARTAALSVLIALAVVSCIIEVFVITKKGAFVQPKMLVIEWLLPRSARDKDATRLFLGYVTTIPMLFILSLGLAGLFACLLQFALVKVVERATPRLTRQVVSFAETTLGSLQHASLEWSVSTTDVIRKLDAQINKDVFELVNTTTTAVDSTLDAFMKQTSIHLNSSFAETILHDPVQDVLRCLMGLKTVYFQDGLTWVQEHAHIKFPEVKNDTFTLGVLDQLGQFESAADLLANSDEQTGDAVTAALHRAVDKLFAGIRAETIVAGALVGTWVFFALVGLVYILGGAIKSRARLKPIAHRNLSDG